MNRLIIFTSMIPRLFRLTRSLFCTGLVPIAYYTLIDKGLKKHLGLWPVESLKVEREKKARPPPKTRAAHVRTDTLIDNSYSQLPVSDKWLYVDPEYPETFPA